MKTQAFSLESLKPAQKAAPARKPAGKQPSPQFPAMSDWGREALKRMARLQRAFAQQP